MHGGLGDPEAHLHAAGEGAGDQVLEHLVLAVDRHPAAGQLGDRDAGGVTGAAQVDAVVREPLPGQPPAAAQLVHEVDRVLLQQPGAVARLDVLAGAVLQDHALDPRPLERQSQGQAGRPRADDRDLRPHRLRLCDAEPPVADETPTRYAREPEGTHPPLDHPPYRSTALRHPLRPLVYLPHTITEITGPQLGPELVHGERDSDLTAQHEGCPIGERIIVSGRVLDTEGKPLRDTLVEIWQANAAGRYRHVWDRWPAELDPNFSGAGRALTDAEGRYRFITIKPGPYPWGNHDNAWRPAHIHFSLLGRAFAQRLVTQMYFPGDPLMESDPIFNSVRDPAARARMICRFRLEESVDHWALAYEFDIRLRGPAATPFEEAH